MNKIDLIFKLASEFRQAIESMDISLFPNSSFFENFPKGCCGDASNLLSKYLSKHGIETEYVWGLKGEQSHAWLEYDVYLIDITADQFSDITQKVIFTTDKSWYNKFRIKDRHDGDFEKYESFNKNRLSIIYNNILRHIPN